MSDNPGIGLVCGACRRLSPRTASTCTNCSTELVLGVDPQTQAPVAASDRPKTPSDSAGRRLSPLEQSGGFLDGVLVPDLASTGGGATFAAGAIGSERTASGVHAIAGDDEDFIPTLGPGAAIAAATSAPIGAHDLTTDDTALSAATHESQRATGARLCQDCGSSVPADYRFCGRCGGAVVGGPGTAPEPEGRGVTVPAEHPDGGATEMFSGFSQEPSKTARLVVVHGEGVDGMVFGIKGAEAVAGRTTGQILFPDDGYVSPSHARFYYRDEQLYVRDEGSENGVFSRITAPADLDDGDLILVGEQLLRVELTRPPPDVPDGEGTFFLGCRVHGGDFRLVQLFPGGRQGLVYVCKTAAVTIGREGCDLNFPTDRFMSRRHAQVESVSGSLRMSDLGSRNGTFVRLKADAHVAHGDHLFIGQQLLRVEF